MKIKVVPIRVRFWWPHAYAREAGLLWVNVVTGYRYFAGGVELFGPCGMDGPKA